MARRYAPNAADAIRHVIRAAARRAVPTMVPAGKIVDSSAFPLKNRPDPISRHPRGMVKLLRRGFVIVRPKESAPTSDLLDDFLPLFACVVLFLDPGVGHSEPLVERRVRFPVQ